MLVLHNVCAMSNGYPNEAPIHTAKIKRLMADRGITQAELAEQLGLTQSSISRRMRGTQPFRTDELERIATALGARLVIDIEGAA
jgi:transcriptional regulator with XRE-family HTH domain